MIKPEHSDFTYSLFRLYLKRIIGRNFNNIFIIDEIDYQQVKDQPILLLQNHFSWWDGFFSLLYSKNYLKKKFHILMLQHKLEEFKFLRKLGAIGMNKSSPKSVAKTMEYINDILKVNNNLVTVYPQGKIYNRISELKLESGYIRILKKSQNTLPILVYCAIEYQSEKKPSVYLFCRTLDRNALLEDENHLYTEFEKSKEKLNSAIMDRKDFTVFKV